MEELENALAVNPKTSSITLEYQ